MKLVKLKPYTPGFRNKIKIKHNLYKGSLYKPLLSALSYKAGRNNLGRITIRHKGGRSKRKYRIIDFKRSKENIPARVIQIEYDPNRNCHIALLLYLDGEKRYIISPKDLLINDTVISGNNVSIKIGNSLPLENIPEGTKIHCLEFFPGKGAQLIRSAGGYGVLISKDKSFVNVVLKSGEIRRFISTCKATVGQVGNENHNLLKLGKAGSNRLKGIRPTVRGVAMNPIDHPHGGGEGKTSGGRDPVSPWGWSTKGFKTSKFKKNNNIIKPRYLRKI